MVYIKHWLPTRSQSPTTDELWDMKSMMVTELITLITPDGHGQLTIIDSIIKLELSSSPVAHFYISDDSPT